MILKSPTLVLYLTNKSLILYDKSIQKISKLGFPPDVLDNQEIVDKAKLEKFLAEFFTSCKIKGKKAIGLISDNLIYQKNIPKSKNFELEKSNFLDEIPFDPGNIARYESEIKDNVFLAATNKTIYNSVKNIFQRLGGNVISIIPAFLIGKFKSAQALTIDEFEQILKRSDLFRKNDYFIESKVIPELEEKKHSFFNTKILLLGVGGSLIILGGLYLLYQTIGKEYLKGQNKDLAKQARPSALVNMKENLASSSGTIEATPSGQVLVNKEEVKFQVFNGTGLSGQAGRVRSILNKLGFNKIEVGNTQRSTNTKTTKIDYYSRLSEKLKDEINQELNKLFSSVEAKEATGSAEFDVVVTTGEEK